jgi:hypothetical protein
MGVLWASEAVSGCNILILPRDASVLGASGAVHLMVKSDQLSPEPNLFLRYKKRVW